MVSSEQRGEKSVFKRSDPVRHNRTYTVTEKGKMLDFVLLYKSVEDDTFNPCNENNRAGQV